MWVDSATYAPRTTVGAANLLGVVTSKKWIYQINIKATKLERTQIDLYGQEINVKGLLRTTRVQICPIYCNFRGLANLLSKLITIFSNLQ